MDLKENEWNLSYKNRDNFVFYPHEDVIRFISKYITKRVGLDAFSDVNEYENRPKVLDFGCGIGRHVKLLDEFGLDAYGFDLSKEAIQTAQENFLRQNLKHLVNKVIVSDITNLPYDGKAFDFMLSHGVLDSMPFEIAKKGMSELHRCLKDGGLIYFDLIATEDSSFNGESQRVVDTKHENGTIQYYYDLSKINELLDGLFAIKEVVLSTKNYLEHDVKISRYHVTIQKV